MNDGSLPGCTTDTCCAEIPAEDTCSAGVAAQCPAGTTCRKNRSARLCTGSADACYLPAGQIGCPGEVLCPNGIDFCPADTRCGFTLGVCPVSSSSGNYCCQPKDPCGATGTWLLHCPERPGCTGAAGTCEVFFELNSWVTLSGDVAMGGATWDEGDRTLTFDPSTCELSSTLNGTLCGSLTGTYRLSADGTGVGIGNTAGCWNLTTSQCSCTVTRPEGECTATRQ